ncbi:MAG TPA: imidazole glycerol phosphate synthase subunit HisH [Longimicrobiales bacterium]|nr:imidazole glycerol phosphate synthase subunit HisH [Longimicrobiales bacterium]
MRIALFDYGVGNLHSLGKALEAEGARVEVTRRWDEALAADGLVLPGVGAFSAALDALPSDRSPIRAALAAGLPCLGICLGMQLLFEGSDEGPGEGIGIIPGRVRRLRARTVPQMGWNAVESAEDPLFDGLEDLTAYYANSFVCEPEDPADALAWSEHDGDRFVAAARRHRTWGAQFHPEKSSHQGRRLLANFLDQVRAASAGGTP